MDSEDGAVKRIEIDTGAPFRSVKEAVMLFGDRFLGGEVYNNKHKEMQFEASEIRHASSRVGRVTSELEETKQSLIKAREESKLMANSLNSLREELEQTKRELQKLKAKEHEKQPILMEIEDLKFVENATKFEEVKTRISNEEGNEFQKKRYVKFANPPPLARVMSHGHNDVVLERHPSMRRREKKPLIPFIGGIFSRKKGFRDVSPMSRVS